MADLHAHPPYRPQNCGFRIAVSGHGNTIGCLRIARRRNSKLRNTRRGTAPKSERGWFATIRYTGWIYDEQAANLKGAQFINSDDKGRPVTFVYGYKRALPGIEKGMEGMKVGARRTLIIPPKLGFASSRQTPPEGVPRDAALVIELELLDVVPQSNVNRPDE